MAVATSAPTAARLLVAAEVEGETTDMRLTDAMEIFGTNERTDLYGVGPRPLKLPSVRSRAHAPTPITMIVRRIVRPIEAEVRTWGYPLSECYAGISSDPFKRLRGDHGIRIGRDRYLVRTCPSRRVADMVEAALQELGMAGHGGGGDSLATSVYVY